MVEGLSEEEQFGRLRVPRESEILGIVTGLVGGSRVRVDCLDGKERICRIPGKIRKRVWVKENDYVIIKPWAVGGEGKGDLVWRYTHMQVDWLKRKGLIKTSA